MNIEEMKQLLKPISSQKLFRLNPLNDAVLLNSLCDLKNNKEEKIQFLYLWGVYDKPNYDEYDTASIDYLETVVSSIAQHVNLNYELTLLICDKHAEVNGIHRSKSQNYINGIKKLLLNKKWKIRLLSEAYPSERVEDDFDNEDLFISQISKEAKSELEKASKKYSRNGCKKNGLHNYVKTRLEERSWLANQFPNSFHLTAANPAISFLQPEMPTFWLWVTGRGKTAKPWFKKVKSE